MLNAKPLLFIDDDEAKVSKLRGFRKQTVGANDHVDRAVG